MGSSPISVRASRAASIPALNETPSPARPYPILTLDCDCNGFIEINTVYAERDTLANARQSGDLPTLLWPFLAIGSQLPNVAGIYVDSITPSRFGRVQRAVGGCDQFIASSAIARKS